MKKHWKLIVLNLGALCLGLYLAVFGFGLPNRTSINPDQVEGLFWPNQKQLTAFEMTDHTGEAYDLSALDGQWNLLFFGYTYCPDICPVTMAMLREADALYRQQAADELKDLKITFVSVDGERDNVDHLANYIRFYDDNWLAATGDKAAVDSLTSQLGVPYQIEPHEPGEKNYLVSHSGTLFLLSPDGRLFATLQPPFSADEVAQRLLTIREFAESQG